MPGNFSRSISVAVFSAMVSIAAMLAAPPVAGSSPAPPATAPAMAQSQPAATTSPAGAVMPAFETDFTTALSRARKEGKVLIAEFIRQDCPYCLRMQTTVYPTPEVVEFSNSVVWVRIDQERGEGIALRRRFQTGSTPMYIAIGHDGVSPYYRFSGATSKKAFLHNMSLLSLSREECDAAHRAIDAAAKPAASQPTAPMAAASSNKLPISQRFTLAKCELLAGRVSSGMNMLQLIADEDPTNQSNLVDDALVLLGMVKNAQSRQTGPDLAYFDWAKVVKQYPTSDRGADAVMYIGKYFRDSNRRDMVDLINPLIKDYPEGVDVAGCAKALEKR